MTTERLFFSSMELIEFEATVVVVLEQGDEHIVILDRTAFYPEGGGQPADHGRLGSARVVDVRTVDGAIEHLVEGELPAVGDRVSGTVDAERRFDHMQQHTGQHLLTRAFINVLDAETLSFHLGREFATIDLPRSSISAEQIEQVEEEAARILRENRPVRVRFHDESGEPDTALRKAPVVEGDLRVITIDDYDSCPCGGTHVSSTAVIESIVVRRVERIRENLCRVEFLCGGRARRDHRRKRELSRRLVKRLSVEEADLVTATDRSLSRISALEKRVRELKRELLPHRASVLVADASEVAGVRVITRLCELDDKGGLSQLGKALCNQSRVVAVLGVTHPKPQLACAASEDSGLDAAQLLKEILAASGGSGGGSPRFAQGGLPEQADVEQILRDVEPIIQTRLEHRSA